MSNCYCFSINCLYICLYSLIFALAKSIVLCLYANKIYCIVLYCIVLYCIVLYLEDRHSALDQASQNIENNLK